MHAFSKALALAAALVAPLVVVVPAHAEDVRRTTVSFADLDLATDAGRAALNRRVHAAAGRVCRIGSPDLASMTAERRCVAGAVADTSAQVAAIVERGRGVALASVAGATQTAAR